MAPIKSNNPIASYFDFFGKSGTDAVNPPPVRITATGGDAVSTPGDGYKYHYYTTTGSSTFVISSGAGNVEYIVIGGGGSGGGHGNGDTGHGGGGAGGLRTNFPGIQNNGGSPLTASDLVLEPGTYPTNVGAGGPGGAGGETGGAADDGDPSTFGAPTSIVATGGGGGGIFYNPPSYPGPGGSPPGSTTKGRDGGSGGGDTYGGGSGPGSGNTPPVSPSQGNSGGNATATRSAGGGGGAGATGSDSPGDNNAGAGGIGTLQQVIDQGNTSTTTAVIPFYYAIQAAFPSATTYHGAIAHSHSDGAMYFAHSAAWHKLANDSEKIAQSNLRTWHFIWSKFYYYKKHYGFIPALIYFFPIIIRINFRVFFYKIKKDKKNIMKYEMRRSGLYSSILNHKSSKRI